MDKDIHLFINDEKIGVINHRFFYDDEANSGREICEGCVLNLHDFRYRVVSVEENEEDYHAVLVTEDNK